VIPTSLRCFLDQTELPPGELDLPEPEARHLVQVRRAGPGDEVLVLNGRGALGTARVVSVGKRSARLDLLSVESVPPPAPGITLAIGALKQNAWDEMLKHAVELGVNRIVRVQTRHAVADLDAARAAAKLARWRELMIEAAKQCACPWLPELLLAGGVRQGLELTKDMGAPLAALLVPGAPMPSACATDGPRVLWIGPEGDFSADEVQALLAAGARPISLGPRILRAETAALALCAFLRLSP